MYSLGCAGLVWPIAEGEVQGILHGNWDLLAGAAAAFAGSLFGTMIANRVMMTGFWTSGDNPRQIQEAHRDFAERARGTADVSDTKYVLDRGRAVHGEPAHEHHGIVTFFGKADYGRVGDDYLEYLHTHAHELGHAIQEKTYPNFDALWAAEVAKHGPGDANWFQGNADDIGRWLMNYSPYPHQFYSLMFAPAMLSASLPTAYDNRKRGDDFWRDLDRAER